MSENDIAIIGMSGRFPGASDIEQFWHNIANGIATIETLDDATLAEAAIDRAVRDDPHYVKARAFLTDADAFDASFFGMSHREAEITDPQHRVLLECAWHALEHAGYAPATTPGAISVFAGATLNTYLLLNLSSNPDALAGVEPVQLNIANASDFLATRIAYKLNLKGASYTVQSACSTSLVAVHIACESLLNYESDMALAGGVSINLSFQHGYRYVEGGMTSPDGQCRPFSAEAQGTIFGSGVGLVVLKRLEDALDAGDTIYAVIKGTATNNDGALKVGYTAPSVDGQAQVIAEALENAGMSAATIDYVEAHGTATPLGDPIEIQALTKAYRATTEDTTYCAIGSVKGNIGHLDAAAGAAGLIKTALALHHHQIPPTLHAAQVNPHIAFETTPFYVNSAGQTWQRRGHPRRAGVSAFGVGGTNAHAVLEEAPLQSPTLPSPRTAHVLRLSAKSTEALEQMTTRLAEYLERSPDLPIADVAHTLQVGRQAFHHRRALIVSDAADAVVALRDPHRYVNGQTDPTATPPTIAFMFSGQGSQYPQMARTLYDQEPLFRTVVDECAAYLQPLLGVDLRTLLYSPTLPEAAERLRDTAIAQPALFVIEYALAQLLESWNLRPDVVVGHSIGEYVAACVAGIFSRNDALKLVAARGRLMATLPRGMMVSVPLSAFEVEPYLSRDVALAAVNGHSRCVLSGPTEAVTALTAALEAEGIAVRPLHTSHAFHSPMMEPILAAFTAEVAALPRHAPRIPVLSNVTGTWLTEAQVQDPGYWAQHLQQTVRFDDNVAHLLQDKPTLVVEVGPGDTLSQLTRRHPQYRAHHTVSSTMRAVHNSTDDLTVLHHAAARLWIAGAAMHGVSAYPDERRRRVPLPPYPFARTRHWIARRDITAIPSVVTAPINTGKATLYTTRWEPWATPYLNAAAFRTTPRAWLVFCDDSPLAHQVNTYLHAAGHTVTVVQRGTGFTHTAEGYTLAPDAPADYERLVQSLQTEGHLPERVLHFWGTTATPDAGSFEHHQAHGYSSVLEWVRALNRYAPDSGCTHVVITNGVATVTGDEANTPAKATVLGTLLVVPQEYPHLPCQVVDIGWSGTDEIVEELLALAEELPTQPVAYRGGQWWRKVYKQMPSVATAPSPLRKGGTYLLTGGLDEIGIELATGLATRYHARLILIEAADFPPISKWDAWLATHSPVDPISQKIGAAQRLQRAGATLTVIPVAGTEPNALRTSLAPVLAEVGPIHGILHNARTLGEKAFRTIEETAALETAWQFEPRIYTLMRLMEVLDTSTLDFVVLNASLASVLGGYGTVAYAAANSFLDAYAHAQHRQYGGRWISIAWEAWQNTQIATVSAELADIALTATEGHNLLEEILGRRGLTQVAISRLELNARIAEWRIKGHRSKSSTATPTLTNRHPRPALATLFIAPTNEAEQTIAAIWEAALGIERIGVLDNFFELGGDSLLAIQTATQLRRAFEMEIPVVALYEGLTVRALAQVLDRLRDEAAPEPPTAIQNPLSEREARMAQRRELQQRQRERRG